MNKFKEYLQQHNIRIVDMCKEIEYHPGVISGVIHGHRKASRKLARRLSKFTHGVFSPEEILSFYKEDI